MTRTLELPYPPSVNTYWRRTSYGGMRVSDEGIGFRLEVMAICSQDRVEPIKGRVRLDVAWHPPDKRKRDIDNILKALLDAMQHAGVYLDDNQISELRIKREEPVPDGMVRVWVSEIEEK